MFNTRKGKNELETKPTFGDEGAEEAYSTKFYTGRLCPKVQPLTLLYTILTEKVPLSHDFITDPFY